VNTRTPTYRLHKPSGQAVVTISGRDVYLGSYGTKVSKQIYDRTIAEWLANGRRLGSSHDKTISEIIVAYMVHVNGRYTSNEPANIKLALRPLQQRYGMTLGRDFGPLALKAVRQAFLEGNLSRGEINKRTRRIVRLFKWAASEELVPPDVHAALKTVEGVRRGQARETEPVKPVADALVDAVKPFVSRQVWTMIQLQRLTGARPGEICMMRTCDLVTTGEVWEYKPSSHKTSYRGKGRVVFIGPLAQEVLRPWLRDDPNAYLFQPLAAEAERRAEMRTRRKTRVQPSQQCRKRTRPKRTPGNRYTPGS
jgi:integrase